MVQRYFNARILRDHAIQEGELWVNNGKIIPPQPQASAEIDLNGEIIAPGYIDLQLNGGFGFDFTSEPESIADVAAQLPQYGVTSFLPTIVSSEPAHYHLVLPIIQRYIGNTDGAEVLGIHLEGPFLNPKRSGAHQVEVFETFAHNSPHEVYGSLEGVKIITLAPENPGSLYWIQQLSKQGIIVSAGHTEATYNQMEAAIAGGLSMVTHLFNAMEPMHHRSPGAVVAALASPIWYSIIADLVHIDPAVIRLAWKANRKGLILITDAISALGLAEGEHNIGAMPIEIREGKAYINSTETLAGSILSMDAAVRNFRKATGCSIAEALEVASLRPAELLRIEYSKGRIEIGADADFIVLDEGLHVLATYVAGEEVWKAHSWR